MCVSGTRTPRRDLDDEHDDDDDEGETEDEDDDDDGTTGTPRTPKTPKPPSKKSPSPTTPRPATAAAAAAAATKAERNDALVAAIQANGHLINTRLLAIPVAIADGFKQIAAILSTRTSSMETIKAKVTAAANLDADLSDMFDVSKEVLPTLFHKHFALFIQP